MKPNGNGSAGARPGRVVCVYCGAIHPTEAKFCPQCGRAVKAPGIRATFGPRYAALLVDLTVVLGIWALSSFVTQPLAGVIAGQTGFRLGGFEAPLAVGTLFQVFLLPLASLFYFGLLEGVTGRTVGKRIVGLKIQRLDGERPGAIRGLARASVVWGPIVTLVAGQLASGLTESIIAGIAVRLGALFMLIVWIANFCMTAFWSKRRGVHDLLAGTENVRE